MELVRGRHEPDGRLYGGDWDAVPAVPPVGSAWNIYTAEFSDTHAALARPGPTVLAVTTVGCLKLEACCRRGTALALAQPPAEHWAVRRPHHGFADQQPHCRPEQHLADPRSHGRYIEATHRRHSRPYWDTVGHGRGATDLHAGLHRTGRDGVQPRRKTPRSIRPMPSAPSPSAARTARIRSRRRREIIAVLPAGRGTSRSESGSRCFFCNNQSKARCDARHQQRRRLCACEMIPAAQAPTILPTRAPTTRAPTTVPSRAPTTISGSDAAAPFTYEDHFSNGNLRCSDVEGLTDILSAAACGTAAQHLGLRDTVVRIERNTANYPY